MRENVRKKRKENAEKTEMGEGEREKERKKRTDRQTDRQTDR